jgi:HK97 gp10 family phage protein
MPDNDIKVEGFKELEQELLSISDDEVADAIQKEALTAAAAVIKPALIAATPVRTKVGGKYALPPGTLKKSVRTRIRLPKNGDPASATVDFGKYSYIAGFVDGGHVNPTAKMGLKHTPANPFVRTTEAATADKAEDAYLSTLQAGIEANIKE